MEATSADILRPVIIAREKSYFTYVRTRAREACFPFLTHVARISNNYLERSRNNADVATRLKFSISALEDYTFACRIQDFIVHD